ncbi:hypothetical protein EV368DRAFT_48519 [Lentinula lateritia]|nr:hypothetical protein EV368DRAFT_48519 [Lentinula lateritia]
MAPFSKPETVLKQAEGLVSVGQTHAALQSLSEMFSSKRFRSTPVTALEPILIRFMELCVELRKGRTAKEGLMQYKNLAQNTNVGSIEVVVGRFIEMAEGKVVEAKEKAREVAAKEVELGGGVAGDVDDLEAPSTPESILLSSVSSPSSASSIHSDRTSRALITPSLKFLWESYRTSLETLKNNARLETIYQSVAQKAFRFCLVNNRKTEFRRLCETLRLHLANVGKYAAQQRELHAAGGAATSAGHHQINLGDPDTLQRHLDTRFAQLNASVELELWQEAFRSIEDIHNLLTMANSMPQIVQPLNTIAGAAASTAPSLVGTTAAGAGGAVTANAASGVGSGAGSGLTSSSLTIKSTMMANYYEKLSRVFLMSGNALYHAAAWAKYYNLVTYAGAKAVGTGESKEVLAGKVIVSALAVPVGSGATSSSSTSTSSTQNPAPSRSALLSSALSRDVLKLAPPTVQKLYHALEVDFDPLTLCESVAPLLEELGGETTPYASYLPLLHQALLSRLLTHLSEVYSSIKISFLIDLLAPLNTLNSTEGTTGITVFTPASIESYIMSCARRGDLDVRIDHAEGSIVFIDEPFAMATSSTGTSADAQANDGYKPVQPSATALVRTRLSSVAGCLYQSLRELEGQGLDSAQLSQEKRIKSLLASLPAYRKTLLLHQSLTARRRQLQQELHARAQAQNLTMQAEAQRRAKEQARLLSLVEARDREAARRKAELEQIRRVEAEKYAKGKFCPRKLTSSTDPIDTTSLIKMQVLALERDKSLRLSRLKTISKRIDHLERAYRVSEMPLLEEDYSVQQGRDRVEWEVRGKETKQEERKIWEEEMATKARLARMRDDWDDRKSALLKRKGEEFALRREKAQRKIESEKSKRLTEVLKHQAEVRAAAEREAAHLLEIEAEEKAAREREGQARLEKEREEREQKEKEEEEQRQEEEREMEQKEKEEKEKEEKRKEREKERQKAMEQAKLQREREEEAEKRRAQRALERAQEKEQGTQRKSTTPSGTPASSVPGTPTKSAFGAPRASAAADIPARSESPAPGAGAKYRPGAGLGGGLGAGRSDGWRSRLEAKGKGEAPPHSTGTEGVSNGRGGGTGSNVPSRTGSPAPGAFGGRNEAKGGEKGEAEDGFTVVGGDKKNVWKPKRGGFGGLGGR